MDEKKINKLVTETLTGKAVPSLSFEEGMAVLEALVQKVENGELPLEDTMNAFEKGSEVVKSLRATLSKAEEKIKLLKKS